ncbi:hypothetical protein [Paenibacillus illinoisensis]|uniref:hypothetical protein n=1 Tax=Paenibacillus illinoisensis TaxID=59845 RepID=UPI00301BD99B
MEEAKLKHDAFLKMLKTIDTDKLTNNSLRKLISKIDFIQFPNGEKRQRIAWNDLNINSSQFIKDIFTRKFGKPDPASFFDVYHHEMDANTREAFEAAMDKLVKWVT